MKSFTRSDEVMLWFVNLSDSAEEYCLSVWFIIMTYYVHMCMYNSEEKVILLYQKNVIKRTRNVYFMYNYKTF